MSSNWSKAVDALFDNNGGEPVSFLSLAETTSLEQKHIDKRNASWNMTGFKIEPKLRPKDPIKNDDSPCQRTIKRQEAIQARWKMKSLQLEGQTKVESLTDAERCERFNSKASHGVTRLDYVLTR